MLADQQAGNDPDGVALWVKNRQAKILYLAENVDVEPLPIKVVLHQDASSGTQGSQQVVVDFQKVMVECEGQPNLPINVDEREIGKAEEEVRTFLRKSLETLRATQEPDPITSRVYAGDINSAWRASDGVFFPCRVSDRP